MLIGEYMAQFEEALRSCDLGKVTVLRKDRHSDHMGFIRAEVYFPDGSVLHLREFVSTHPNIERYRYSYHYQAADSSLVFRYDNTRHHPELETFPHHRHTESGVAAAMEPELKAVLDEVVRRLWRWRH